MDARNDTKAWWELPRSSRLRRLQFDRQTLRLERGCTQEQCRIERYNNLIAEKTLQIKMVIEHGMAG